MLLGTFERVEKLRFTIIRCCVIKRRWRSLLRWLTCLHFNLQMSVLVPLPEGELSPFSSSKHKFITAKEKKKSAKNLFSVSITEMTDECKSLQASDWCFSKMRGIRAHHAHTLVPAAVHPASTRQPQSHLSTSLSQARTWGGRRGTVVPHLSISTLTCGWELNQAYPVPEWVGHWEVMKNWPSLAQLQVSHQSFVPVLWLAGCQQVQHLKSAVCLREIKAGYSSWHKTNLFWGNRV